MAQAPVNVLPELEIVLESGKKPILGVENRENDKRKRSKDCENDKFQRSKISGPYQKAACCSCQKRRKKCDSKYPSCSACEKLGLECTFIYHPTGREIRKDYLESLETKIKELESQVYTCKPSSSSTSNFSDRINSESPSISFVSGIKYPPTLKENKDLTDEVGFITLNAAGDPYYIGETSAYSIAKAINSSIDCYSSNYTKNEAHISVPEDELPFKFPCLQVAEELFNCYKRSVHCQYPFLDWSFAEKCFDIIIVKKSQDKFANFFIFMIFAIASQIQNTSNNNKSSRYTKAYYIKAFETANFVFEVASLRTVQAFLLIAVFSQKMPDGVSGWQAIGLAIRTSIVLGLHRKAYKKRNESMTNEQLALQDLKSRVFWSAYGIERINGLVLGRPFSISDTDIDAPFPIENKETMVACHVVKLRRIQSNIYTFIYKPVQIMDQPNEIDATRVEILLELNEWMRTFPYKDNALSTFETSNWSLISYHNSILLLLRPVILEISKLKENSSPRFLEWFKVFTESASAICINYKNMYLKKKLSYTWLAMHCCFVAGISFLYCIWLDRFLKVLKWKNQCLVYESISACQTILYVLTERWESASVFRDSFERLANIVKSNIDTKSNEQSSQCDPVTQIIDSGIFVEGSIGIDSYITAKKFKETFKSSIEETDGALFTLKDEMEMENQCEDDPTMDSLWEFLDNTGDRYLRDLFNEMEDSIGLYK
ncbi:hypothetical protein CANINC_003131 [Pichia inconspicua]|uniref:Zn(2)-C6 fungal-type domain-containing protein n=1 Tax=Pichia inconspicua TaxID=52247 RepID=A0A4T0WZS2_9ASCO|nr:hypothetical protein CANINC_003131 [[Candida] inconspicua]